MRTVEHTVYAFDELSPGAQEAARQWWRACAEADLDLDHIMEDAEQVAGILGVSFDRQSVRLMGGGTRMKPAVYYSGFWTQGDGACFEGGYAYCKGAAKRVYQYAPTDKKLHSIANRLQSAQRRAFYQLEARMTHRGGYCHSGSMAVEVSRAGNWCAGVEAFEDDIRECMRDFADWIYEQLEQEYEYSLRDEYVEDSIRANGYEFDESGAIV